MAASPLVALRNLGWFALFMRGYGLADQSTRDELYADTLDYRAGRESGDALEVQASTLLRIPLPSALA